MERKLHVILKKLEGVFKSPFADHSVFQYIWMDEEEKEIMERYFKDNTTFSIQEIV